ncbi:neural cell adhesion molecule 2 [Parasteatoda tepidariorum]|uniref:neural cell adhesion molecule 2 n=1 Tax=Parasteatoda tepidariorum TaxID=114398 RepID=UPI001C722853|nr:synaptogenesis protein syg-2 [Parasteatoda tepidariorum]
MCPLKNDNEWSEGWRTLCLVTYSIPCFWNMMWIFLLLCNVQSISATSRWTVVLRSLSVTVVLRASGLLSLCSASSPPVRPEFLAVSGEMATLPCNISTPLADDAASLILWYREDLPNPIYTLDIRKMALKKALHFPSPEMEGRAYFDINVHPPLLKIYPIRKPDQGDYKCRVDLRRSRTFIHYIRLKILVPPKVVITDEHGQTMQDVIGPYDEGSSVSLFCEASDGEPQPSLTWWKGNILIDDTYNITPQEVVRNELLLLDLQRSDLLVEITCQAFFTNLTKPRTRVVMLDLNLRPLEVKVMPRRRPLSVEWIAQLTCEARGGRPQAVLTWWREGKEVEGTSETILEDGNLTMSTYAFTPKAEDNGKTVTCKATHPNLPMDPITDTVSLNVHYPPQLKVAMGASNQHSGIKEGSDVYFECNIKSNPAVTEVTWYADDDILSTNVSRGVQVNNQSLILRGITKESRGHYRCQAINIEGQGESDVVKLDVQYSPVCKFAEQQTYNIFQGEAINITCDVESLPRPSAFQWTLNNTLRSTVDLKRRHPKIFGALHYVPRYLGDFGTIMCWGKNDVGVQRIPCIFHLIPEGEVTTDLGVLAPSTDEEDDESNGRNDTSGFILSPAVGVLVGVVVAIIVMILIIVIVMKLQDPPPKRRTYFEEEKFKYPSPLKKDPNDSLVDGNEKSPDIIPLPSDIEVYATSVAVEMCSASPRLPKQVAEVYYTVESQTCV